MTMNQLRGVLWACVLGTLAISNNSFAQTGKANQRDIVPPPPTVKSSDDLEPTVTIKKVDGQEFEEYRIRGKLYMMRVTPKGGGKPYLLIDKQGTGHFEVGENYSPHLSVPQWVILEF